MTRIGRRTAATAIALLAATAPMAAHSGPPYPAISSQTAGRYNVAVWTDPDTTDDRTAQGKFWVTLRPAAPGPPIDPATRVEVSIRPTDRAGAVESLRANLTKNDPATFFAALLMDHEGPFAVHVAIDGPAGRGEVDCEVQATYDLRPSPFLLILYVMPFVLVAFLWGKLLITRRARRGRARSIA
jgi:hypothetical protein